MPIDKKARKSRYTYLHAYEARRAEKRLLFVSQIDSGRYVSILSRLPNLHGFRFVAKHQSKLDWAGDIPESLQEAIANVMPEPNLTAFTIAEISGFPQPLLLELHQIQVLEIWDTTFVFPTPEVEFPASNLLKYLVVVHGHHPDSSFDNLIYNFMERSAETLEQLTWMMDEEHEGTPVASRLLST